MLERKSGETLQRGAINSAATNFNICRKTVSRIWKRASICYPEGKMVPVVDSVKKGRVGRKKKDHSEKISKIKDIEQNRRGTFRSLSTAIRFPKSTLGRAVKDEEGVKKHRSTVEPCLTFKNVQNRLNFCRSMLT